MKTPADPAIRIGRRKVDAIRLRIKAEIECVSHYESALSALEQERKEECTRAGGDWTISTYEWLRARQAQAHILAEQRMEASERLERLREEATQTYGQCRALEKAADARREQERQSVMRKAQAEADDLSNARRLLKLRAAAAARKRDGHDPAG